MAKQDLLHLFAQNKQLTKWLDNLDSGRQLVMGFSGASKALAIASAFTTYGKKILIVTATHSEAERLVSDLTALLDEDKVFHFFADDIAATEFVFASLERASTRLEAMHFLKNPSQDGILVTNIAGMRVLLPNPKSYQSVNIHLQIGDEIDVTGLDKQLTNMGYKKVSQVISPAEFSRRGDILDFYSLSHQSPVRIEFFGDEIDSIRFFDSETQTSIETLEAVELGPVDDIILTSEDFERAVIALEKHVSTSEGQQKDYLKEVLSVTKDGHKHANIRRFLSLFYEKPFTLLDYLPEKTPIFFDDFPKIIDRNSKFDLDIAQLLTEDLQKGQSIASLTYFTDSYRALRNHLPATMFSNFHKGLGNLKFSGSYQFNQYPMQEFFNQFPLLVDEINRYQKQKATVVVQCDSEQSLERLHRNLQDYQLNLQIVDKNHIQSGQAQLVVSHLSQGFYYSDERLVLITEREIYHKKMKRRIRRQHLTNAERLKDYNELAVGDYVVHHVHGIGKFLGIETIELKGIHRDYLTIQYDNSDRISIPVEQIEVLSKYMASDGKVPKVNKLNDGRFQKAKQKVVKQVEDIADDLIKLYAERSQLKGFAFSPDDTNQEEFDNDFAYAETDDQLRSINEIKADMESDTPMDRLLVGDVGFGKTEVAMRAAFKAVNDGKQVAILVPTTVLAQQHYDNFRARFDNFAVTVDVLSRFRTKAEQAKTLEDLKKGKVDIIVGTHRLLSKDVVFQDLGLIVIDEEQRFGVKHKETLKELKKKVDVLTLTATPIPRTLHMSMLGIRDLSVIETPPVNRFPVQTYVMETNHALIREAIIRELDRGGQIYYIYNKVDTIDNKVAELSELVPEARIGFVHGQMSEIQLENTLFDFINGEYDILVATTIIEIGVDIANANTMFIENADYMGLSTLYQLRGRVGRSNRIAYAYLMYKPDKVLTEVSEKRLDAIKGFTELGSGFKIAMQDLSIRGAGNILGASQSGFIDSVGFELYSQLLEQAIAEKQGQSQARQKGNAELQLQIDAYLPSDYIADERQKIAIYKRIRELESVVDYEELQDELIDRFGEYPDQVAYLLEIGLVKAFMDKAFVAIVDRKQDKLTVSFETVSRHYYLTQDYFEALSKTQLKASISENDGKIDITFTIKGLKDYQIIEELRVFGEALSHIRDRKANL